VTVALAAFTAASLIWAGHTAALLRARESESLSGLAAPLHRSGPRLVLSVDAFARQNDSEHQEIPYYAPLFNLGPLYAVAHGGIPAFGFLNNPRIHPFVMSAEGRKRYPPLFNAAELVHAFGPRIETDPAARAEMLTLVALTGAPFEDVVIAGRPEDGDLLLSRGYVEDFREQGLFIGHLQGCPRMLRVTVPSGDAARVLVEYVPEPLPRSPRKAILPPGPEPARDMLLSPALCGPMWLRVTLDRDGSGTASKGDAFCEGADSKGRLHVTPRGRTGAPIECQVVP
jgi:hypothetical protein